MGMTPHEIAKIQAMLRKQDIRQARPRLLFNWRAWMVVVAAAVAAGLLVRNFEL
jgi:hypothetical protein